MPRTSIAYAYDRERVVGCARHAAVLLPIGDPAEFADMNEEDQAAMAFLERFTAGGGLAYNA